MQLDPGDAHPNAPCSAEDLARRLDIELAVIDRWRQGGMPALPDGRLDPFVVVSWVSWQRLNECPLLAGRWRAWLSWFTTVAKPVRVSVRRSQQVFLPESRSVRWWVPEPPDAPGQRIIARQWSEGTACGQYHRLITRTIPATTHQWTAEDEIELAPHQAEPRDRSYFEALIADFAGAFTYSYRRHRPGEAVSWTGTCLDIAQLCGAELDRRQRPWRLVSGVVAHRQLANPHCWVEVDDGSAGWIPLDPTIPAIARMLGADWRAVIPLAVGRHDARRIRVGDSAHSPPASTALDLGGAMGAVEADGDGALACTDWAIGECSWSIAVVKPV
ncbi:MAG: transglutaminase domain-containing protein [Planctomycetota bacterium]